MTGTAIAAASFPLLSPPPTGDPPAWPCTVLSGAAGPKGPPEAESADTNETVDG